MRLVIICIALLFAQSAYAYDECKAISYNDFIFYQQVVKANVRSRPRRPDQDPKIERQHQLIIKDMDDALEIITPGIIDSMKGCNIEAEVIYKDDGIYHATSRKWVTYSEHSFFGFDKNARGQIVTVWGKGLPGDQICRPFGAKAYNIASAAVSKNEREHNGDDEDVYLWSMGVEQRLTDLLAETGCEGEELSRVGNTRMVRYTSAGGGDLLVTFGSLDQMLAVSQSGLAH